jgi:hypothetical protein
MRLSEKTIELTFCHQYGSLISPDLVWFGLTQAQESKAGFDACTRIGGRLLLLQFKASAFTLGNGRRRFYAEHDQMVALRNRCVTQRGIFYVFPLIGTTQEIAISPNILSNTWFLDVADLPNPIPPPVKRDGTVRKNGVHYVDVQPYEARIWSQPFPARLYDSQKLAYLIRDKSSTPIGLSVRDEREFIELRSLFKRNAIAAII